MLSGKFNSDTTFAPSDHRNYNRDGQCFNVGETFAGIPFDDGVELAERMKDFVPHGMTLAQLALRWILDHDAVSVVIPGASSPQQVVANTQVSEMPALPGTLHSELFEFYRKYVQQRIRGAY